MKPAKVVTEEKPTQSVMSKKGLLKLRSEARTFVQKLALEPGELRDLDSSQRLTNIDDRLQQAIQAMHTSSLSRIRSREYQALAIADHLSKRASLLRVLTEDRRAQHEKLTVLDEGFAESLHAVKTTTYASVDQATTAVAERLTLQDSSRAAFEVKLNQERLDRLDDAKMSLKSIQDGIDALRLRFSAEVTERESDIASLKSSIDAGIKPIAANIKKTSEETRLLLIPISTKSDLAAEASRGASMQFEEKMKSRLTLWEAAILRELRERVRASIETAELTEKFLKSVEVGIKQDTANARNHV